VWFLGKFVLFVGNSGQTWANFVSFE
jgi:hypothetical protein